MAYIYLLLEIGDACTNQTDGLSKEQIWCRAWHGMAWRGEQQGGGQGLEEREERRADGIQRAMRCDGIGAKGGVAAHTSGTAREGLFLSAKKAEDESKMNSNVVDRTRGHPLESFGAQARPPCLASTTKNNISEDF